MSNRSYEDPITVNSKFPNATITTTNNAKSVQTYFQSNTASEGGWIAGITIPTVGTAFVINDATRASDGAQFWYIPKAQTPTAGPTMCAQTDGNLPFTNNTTCATYNVKAGKRYIMSVDFVPFDVSNPSGGVGTATPVFEVNHSDGGLSTETVYNSSGAIATAQTAVAWNNVGSSWQRYYAVYTGVAVGTDGYSYSFNGDATSGALFDNTSFVELQMTASGIGAVSCNVAGTGRYFTLNPVSNVGSVPGLKYTVTAPAGYAISPTMGTYGQPTGFTLTKTTGSAIGTGPLSITLSDEVNTECTITQTISDPTCSANACCTNEIMSNTSFENAITVNTRFPNATITTTNNAKSVETYFQSNVASEGGWIAGLVVATVGTAFVINDATRASDGAQFWYIPKAQTPNASQTLCVQTAGNIPFTNNTTCATYNVKAGKRYIMAADFTAFDVSNPGGGTGFARPTFEVNHIDGSYDSETVYNSSGVVATAQASVAWNNVASSWQRYYAVYTGFATGTSGFSYSLNGDGTAGALIDNTSFVELQMTASGIGAVSCNGAGTGRVFTLDPVSNVGGVPGLKYTVTAPAGYAISPTMGMYGESTSFTLTNTSGSAIGTGPLNITLSDEVNTECTITETIADPSCVTCSLTNAGETLETCNNNGTTADDTDDYITFSLNPVGTGLGATYTVSVNNGGTVTPTSGTYGSATAFQLQSGSADGTTLYTITITDVSGGTCTVTTTVQQNPCSVTGCTPPTATFIKAPGNCTGITQNNNGAVLIATTTGAPDRYGIVSGGTYTGVNYAGAAAIGSLPFVVQTGVSNSGGTYTVRIFAGSDACFADYTVTVPAATCPSDPMGYIYCEETGMIISGGTITITNVPAGGSAFITFDGSNGYYQFFTNGVAGNYTFAYTPPSGYMLSTSTLPGASYNPDPALPNPDVLGSDNTDGTPGFLDDFSPAANPYYFTFSMDAGDPEILLNNIPLKGCCLPPSLTVSDGVVCSGESIDLSTLANGTGGTITYHATYADAVAGTPTIPFVVSPISATNYYVRNASSATCYTVKEVVVRIAAPTCGTIQVAGPGGN